MSMIHEITQQVGAHKRKKRKGRGEGSNTGKTAGKGTKGRNARSGPGPRTGYEGGQTPIFNRFPKRGFSNARFARPVAIVNLSMIEKHFEDGATVDAVALVAKGLIRDEKLPVKVLGDGDFSRKITIVADRFSESAMQKLQATGSTQLDAKGLPFEPTPRKSRKARKAAGAAGAVTEAPESGEPTAGDDHKGSPTPNVAGQDAPASEAPESGTKPE